MLAYCSLLSLKDFTTAVNGAEARCTEMTYENLAHRCLTCWLILTLSQSRSKVTFISYFVRAEWKNAAKGVGATSSECFCALLKR